MSADRGYPAKCAFLGLSPEKLQLEVIERYLLDVEGTVWWLEGVTEG